MYYDFNVEYSKSYYNNFDTFSYMSELSLSVSAIMCYYSGILL